MTRQRRVIPGEEAPQWGAGQSSDPIHVKYRPRKLEEVLGQAPVVKSLQTALGGANRPHTYLFTGPSGCGKTTLARIIASMLGISGPNVLELDAATKNGVDDMREITSVLRYQGFGDSPRKLIILDECHQLSKQAWNSILKSVEEPPPHVFFVFCTTEPAKVPETIRTRCSSYNLQPVKFDLIMDLLEMVCKAEGYDTPEQVLSLVAKAANGSPRQALVGLASVHSVRDLDEVALLLQEPGDSKEVIDLCRALVGGKLNWDALTKTLKAMPDMPPESVRLVVVNYLAACLMGARGEKDVVRLLDMLSCFSKPCNASEKWAPILLAFGSYIYP